MGAKAIFHQGKWRVQVNLEGKSRIITRLRDFVRNKDYPDQQVAEIVAEIVNTQVLVGNFRWEFWFPHDGRKFNFKTLAYEWLSKNRKPSTQYQYNLLMDKYILPIMAKTDVRKIHRTDFYWIKEQFGDTAKAKSIRSVASNFLNWCYKELEGKEMGRIFLPEIEVPQKPLPYVDRETREQIQATVAKEYQNATLLSLRMGLRAAEIASLEWDNVEEDGLMIKHNLSYYKKTTLKEGKARFAPYQGEVKEKLATLKKSLQLAGILPVGLVFRLPSKARMWPNLISFEWSKAARGVGVDMRMHHNRHCLGQDMLEEGCSMTEVKAILGHKSERTTEDFYARHNRAGMVKIAKKRVERIIKHNESRNRLE